MKDFWTIIFAIIHVKDLRHSFLRMTRENNHITLYEVTTTIFPSSMCILIVN